MNRRFTRFSPRPDRTYVITTNFPLELFEVYQNGALLDAGADYGIVRLGNQVTITLNFFISAGWVGIFYWG